MDIHEAIDNLGDLVRHRDVVRSVLDYRYENDGRTVFLLSVDYQKFGTDHSVVGPFIRRRIRTPISASPNWNAVFSTRLLIELLPRQARRLLLVDLSTRAGNSLIYDSSLAERIEVFFTPSPRDRTGPALVNYEYVIAVGFSYSALKGLFADSFPPHGVLLTSRDLEPESIESDDAFGTTVACLNLDLGDGESCAYCWGLS